MRVTITIDEGEARTVASAGEGAATVAQTGAEQVTGPEPIDGGSARAFAELEAVEAEVTGGQVKGPEVSGTGPIDAGPAPVLAMDGDSEGLLPLGGSPD